jgi:hypothetical protein
MIRQIEAPSRACLLLALAAVRLARFLGLPSSHYLRFPRVALAAIDVRCRCVGFALRMIRL